MLQFSMNRKKGERIPLVKWEKLFGQIWLQKSYRES